VTEGVENHSMASRDQGGGKRSRQRGRQRRERPADVAGHREVPPESARGSGLREYGRPPRHTGWTAAGHPPAAEPGWWSCPAQIQEQELRFLAW